MRAYEEYKDSGYDWLGKIPAHWEWLYLFQICREQYQKNNTKEELPVLSLSYGKIIIKENIDFGLTPNDYSTYQIVKNGNIILRLTDLQNDHKSLRTGLVKNRGIITSAYTCITTSCNYNFIHYLLHAYDCHKIFYGLGGGVRQSIGYAQIKNIKFPIPPREEQDAIIRFLDAKCAKIDSLIKLKERQIALLNEKKQSIINQVVTRGLDPNAPMKDSGVDYIGMIPSHWQVILNHRLWEEKTRGYSTTETVLSLSQQDGVVPYEDMTERSLHTSSYDNWKLVFPGDLVVNRFKAHLGVFFSSAYRGIVTFHYGIFQFKMNGSTKYYEYLYHTPKFCRVYASLSNGMTVGLQNLSNSHFYSAYSVYPPVHEQKEIVDKIETINVIYRNKIKIIENEILILHEYKTKLISDVVTGKINVL